MNKQVSQHIAPLAVTAEMELPHQRPLVDTAKIGRFVKRKRTWKYGSAMSFANACGVSAPTIFSLEKGSKTQIGLINFDKIARALGMTLIELLVEAEKLEP